MIPTQDEKDIVESDGISWLNIFRRYEPDITEEKVMSILWEHTCYPFSDRVTVKQIEQYYSQLNQQTNEHKR